MTRTKILDRFLDPVGSYLTREVTERLVSIRADTDTKTQRRLDELAEKNQAETLTDKEREEYDTYISVIDFVTVHQAKARSVLKSDVTN